MRTASITTVTVGLIGLCFLVASCSHWSASAVNRPSRLTDEEKHRLYAAALAASDAPLDSEIFKRVCRKLDIFDATGRPNENYVQFVGAHVDWATKRQTEQFRNEINTPEKARKYINQRLEG